MGRKLADPSDDCVLKGRRATHWFGDQADQWQRIVRMCETGRRAGLVDALRSSNKSVQLIRLIPTTILEVVSQLRTQ